MRRLALVLAVMIILVPIAAGCGDGNEASSVADAASTTVAETVVTTTTAAQTTVSSAPPTSSTTVATTTTAPPGVDIATVAAWVQERLDEEFARSDPPEGVLGAVRIVCAEPGMLPVGGVIACSGEPQTTEYVQLDPVGVVLYVLGTAGAASWSMGTDLPDSTEGLVAAHAAVPTGLLCRDLLDPEVAAGIFGGAARPAESAFFWSLVYWSLEGEPDRMDADLDGVPCETLYSADVVDRMLGGVATG